MKLNLLKIARKPPLVVEPNDSVIKAVKIMAEVGVGAVAVTENSKLVGIFTERDLLNRVVDKGSSTSKTTIGEVMTPNPQTVSPWMKASEAFELMTDKHLRHLPVVGEEGELLGMLSVRHLMDRIVENLSDELEGLNAYITADGIGG